MSWPGNGSYWYHLNPSQNDTRRGYYSVNGVPDTYLDGTSMWYTQLAGSMPGRLNTTTPVEIIVDPEFNGETIDVYTTVNCDEDLTGTYKLYAALCETEETYSGSVYHNPMVWMSPSASGQQIMLGAGSSQDFTLEFPYDEDQWEVHNLTAVVFIQNNSTDEILQSANAQVPAITPFLQVLGHTIDDAGQWRENGRPDAGETVDLIVDLGDHEIFQPASGISATLSCDDDQITINTNTSNWPDLLPGQHAENADNPFNLTVPDDYEPAYVTFTLDVTADEYSRSIEMEILMGVPDILFVNDIGSGTDYRQFWETMSEEMGVVFDYHEGASPTTNLLNEYGNVIWATGVSSASDEVIDPLEQTIITGYLSNGGHMLLTSQYAVDLYGDDTWFQDYFGCSMNTATVANPNGMIGEGHPDGPFADASFVIAGAGGAGNNSSPSSVNMLHDDAVPFYNYMGGTDIAGIGVDAENFRTVYLGFPLEAVSGASATNTAADLLADLLYFLEFGETDVEPGNQAILPTSVELNAYPNPFNPDLNINFNLPASMDVRLEVYNVMGQKVASLVNGKYEAGNHKVTWKSENTASGIYLVRLSTPQEVSTQKVTLLR